VKYQTKFSRNITLNVPIVSAAMDTVTERCYGNCYGSRRIGVLHKNMTIEQQAAKVRKVKRAESGMIIDPVTLPLTAKVADAKNAMKEYGIGGIPIIDEEHRLKEL
jgi:IMP dehydrogenase